MRRSRDSLDISSEKMATTLPSRTPTFSAILIAHAVFPMPGRAAMMIRSEGCRPQVILSKAVVVRG